jgi:oligopeptidase B
MRLRKNKAAFISRFIYSGLAVLLLINVNCSKTKEGDKMKEEALKPPVVKEIKKELTIHNNTRTDEYYWLNQREKPEVIKHLEAENSYRESVMEHTKEFQDKLFHEIIGRIKKTDNSVPYKFQGYYYFTRFEEKGEYPVYCRKKDTLANEEETLLDVNKMARGHKYYNVAGHSISTNNQLLAFGVDEVSRRKYKIYFKDLSTGKLLNDQIPNTTGNAVWANDNKTVFYSTKDKTLRSYKIFKHILGTDVNLDVEVFHETDPTFSTQVSKSKSQEYIFISSYQTLSSEFRFIKADEPNSKFKIFHRREQNLEYNIDHFKDHFYIRTNLNATNFKLMKTPINKTTKNNWKDLIPHRQNVLFENYEIFKEFLVLGERKNGLRQIRVIKWDQSEDYYLQFDEPVFTSFISTNPEFDTKILRFGYTSLTTPRSTYDFDMISKEKKLLKQDEVVGDFNPNDYFAERLFAIARDKTKIPISLVYKKGLKKDGENPLLLYGYGSYGASMDPYFSSVRLSLLNRGFVYAIAHIRGGQEMGRKWYEDGKLLKKKNTFYDFIDCADFLIKEKFTRSQKLFAIGGSAGGLLMGAVINYRPELFKGVVAAVPWVDVVTTMLDDSIPLTTSEYDEWGNPNKKEYYNYMLSYSPYDNVGAKPYPALLVTTGLHDSQVQYFEPVKWVQRLRKKTTSNNKIIMHINMSAGHGGTSGRFKRFRETALEYAFIFDLLGITE